MTPANAKSLQHCYTARDFFDGRACGFDEPRPLISFLFIISWQSSKGPVPW